MPILIADRERCVLQIGTNVLGGIGPDAVDVAALHELPRVAVITISRDGPAMIQRLSPRVVVKLGDETLGAVARELRDGSEIAVGGFRLRYGTTDPEGITSSKVKPKASELATEVLPAVSAPDRPARTSVGTHGEVRREPARHRNAPDDGMLRDVDHGHLRGTRREHECVAPVGVEDHHCGAIRGRDAASGVRGSTVDYTTL